MFYSLGPLQRRESMLDPEESLTMERNLCFIMRVEPTQQRIYVPLLEFS